MPGSSECLRWNVCVHRLDLGLYSHPKEFWGNGVRTQVNSKGKSLPPPPPSLTGRILPQRRIEPTTLHQAGQQAQHTTNELFRPPRSGANFQSCSHFSQAFSASHASAKQGRRYDPLVCLSEPSSEGLQKLGRRYDPLVCRSKQSSEDLQKQGRRYDPLVCPSKPSHGGLQKICA